MHDLRYRRVSAGILFLCLAMLCPPLSYPQRHPSQLVGTWEIQTPQGTARMVLNADGKGILFGQEVHWAFNQETLVLVGPGGELVYKAAVTADTLTLSGGGLKAPVTWRRAGSAGASQAAPSAGFPAAAGRAAVRSPAPSSPVGTWEAQGAQGAVSMVFKPDGTGIFNGEPGKWTYSRGVLNISDASGSAFAYTASISANSLTLSGGNLPQPMTFQRVGGGEEGVEPGMGTDVEPEQGMGVTAAPGGPVGVWQTQGKDGPVIMDLRPDGSGAMAGENVRWQFNQGVLSIARQSGTTHMYKAAVTPNSITLESAGLGRPVTFTRVGPGQRQVGRPAGVAGGAGAQSPQAQGASLAATLIGRWQGTKGIVEIRPDGTFVFPGGGVAPYTIEGDALTLQATDGVLRFKYSLAGNTLTLTAANGATLVFTRLGDEVQ